MKLDITIDENNPSLGILMATRVINNPSVSLKWSSETKVSWREGTASSSALIFRILARQSNQLYCDTPLEKTSVDHWLTFAGTELQQPSDKSLQYLDYSLKQISYLVGDHLTVADLAVFDKIIVVRDQLKPYNHINRWYNFIEATLRDSLPLPENVANNLNNVAKVYSDNAVEFFAKQAAIASAKAISNANQQREQRDEKKPAGGTDKNSQKPPSQNKNVKANKPQQEKGEDKGKKKDEGKFVELPGAEIGKVIVRFPPEASGYLHIGHAKAALLNQHYQQMFQGKLIMRFDDTNPAKEKEAFEEVILEDLKMLEVKPDIFTYTSDSFDLMLGYCERLLKEGKAYVDDTEAELMRDERIKKIESRNRSNTPEKNLELWEEMKKGTETGQKCCVRAKIDMNSPNGCMRDPTIYRCKDEPHPRTGTKYKVYPTYDFACPIVDSIEGVTHALRTTEYHDRDDQFFWFIDALGLRKPHIYEYSRLNLMNTVLSKRKLTWFVDEGYVDGWDDPRFPTVRGVLRRGMTVEGLKQFIVAQGSSRSVVMMQWDKIWSFNRQVIDPIAPRHTGLIKEVLVPVNVKGASVSTQLVDAHPKNASVGKRLVQLSPVVMVEHEDASLFKEGENVTFINWGNLKIDKVNRKNGAVESVDASLNLDDKNYKNTLKITWLHSPESAPLTPITAVYYDHIISKSVLGPDEDFKQFIGKDTKILVNMVGDADLQKLKKGDIVQLQRKGFYICDVPYKPRSPHTCKEDPVVLIAIPDGKTKENPTGKLPSKQVVSDSQSKTEVGGKSLEAIDSAITAQGNLVRDLKSKKAAKGEIDQAVKQLLTLKQEFKATAGKDWDPKGNNVEAKSTAPVSSGSGNNNCLEAIDSAITAQGNLVRDLKSKKAAKGEIDQAVKQLLTLKQEFKAAAGKDWDPKGNNVGTKSEVPTPTGSKSLEDIDSAITAQGSLVRDLKSKKASKAEIDEAVKQLLSLKSEFKAAAGKDWNPNGNNVEAKAAASTALSGSKSLEAIDSAITAQGSLVRDLKSKKASKAEIDEAVKQLLSLKGEFKAAAGKDWNPNGNNVEAKPAAPAATPATSGSKSLEAIDSAITAQGNLVRDLKAQKASKAEIDEAVKQLLSLKGEFKAAAGKDWNPKGNNVETKTAAPAPVSSGSKSLTDIDNAITTQGNLVRDLKSQKASKVAIDQAVKTLLALKAEFKAAAGKDWNPKGGNVENVEIKAENIQKSKMSDTANNNSAEDEIKAQIEAQGNKVRQLKEAKASKDDIDAEVKGLLALKNKYKEVTGKDFAPPGGNQRSGGARKETKKQAPQPPVKTEKEADSANPNIKKQTRLGLEAKKSENLSDWFSQVITKGEMIEYYDVSGCYIFRPWSYAIWEAITKWFDTEIKKLGVQNCYFPMFVSQSALEKEKDHIADFAPEVAWVTKSGDTDLAEPIAIRPTSETVMYPSFAKWVQSYRDLPIKLNQWNSVVRWEFKHPQPFLRTREFLWQEGHSAFATYEEAEKEVYDILGLYEKVYTDLLAIPVIPGKKTEKEKFPGGDYTTTVEAFVSASGRGLQGATSHHLGQNFSKMFEIVFEDPESREKKFAYQNSWGLSTRTIGAMVMVHSDDKGLVLPPRVAAFQVVIVPCGITASTSEADNVALIKECEEYERRLKEKDVRVKGDYRDNYSPGWKFNHWELKGVPIRIEIGPRDLKQNQYVTVTRFNGEKSTLQKATLEADIAKLLTDIHTSMFNKAKSELDAHVVVTENWTQFTTDLDKKNIIMSPFCGRIDCEEQIKKDSARDEPSEPGAPAMGAKSLCIPFKQPKEIDSSTKCIHPKCNDKAKFYTLFGRSY